MTTVLVVDDNQELRRLLRLILVHEGYSVLLAADGAEALAMVQQHRPAVVFCDFMLPKLDGPEFVRQLRAQPDPMLAQTPVIGFTAMDGIDQEFLAAGANVVLPKPSRRAEIIRVVGEVVKGRQPGG